jgi:kanamycin kinase
MTAVNHDVRAGMPTGPVAIPDVVAALARGGSVTPVWRNQLGGLTFRLDDGRGGSLYVKWVAAGTPEIDFRAEAERLSWARRWTPVPAVVEQGGDGRGSWLVTSAMRGRSAVDPRWVARPETAVAGIGRGLRHLHDTLPVAACPFDWSVERRLLNARERTVDSREFALREARLGTAPPIDRLVVGHGDACAPNTLLHDDGTFAAHVDLGSLGVADRWADLAVAAWSTEWNYGPGYDGIVYAAYGVAPDPVRVAYYRALWDLT